MLIILSVFLGTLIYFCGQLSLLLVMFGWLVKSLLLVSVCCSVLLKLFVLRCVAGFFLMRVISGLKRDVRVLGGHLDTTLRGWSYTLSLRVRLVISRLDLIFAFPLDFFGRVRVVRAMFLPCALHGVETSYFSKGSFLKLLAAVMRAVWSRKQPLASSGAVLGLFDGPHGSDPSFCIVWFRFRLFRRYLSFRPDEVPRLYRLLDPVRDGCSVMVLFMLLLPVLIVLASLGTLL